MRLNELSEDQKDELRMDIVFKRAEAEGRSPGYGELAGAYHMVSDEDLEREFGGTWFVPDDFACSKRGEE